MSFMNFNFGLIAFEDQNITNPTVRSVDITRSMTGIPITAERTDRVDQLRTGESKVIASTLRSTLQDNTTGYDIVHPLVADVSTVRLQWNGIGTNPNFALKRSIGTSAVSSVAISRLNPATARVTSVGMSTVSVQVGDILKFEKSTDTFTSVFSVINQNAFKVVSTGSNYIDVMDNGAMSVETFILGAQFDKQMRCFSVGPVQVGDTIEIMGTGQNIGNMGKYEVREISYDYVQIINPYAVDLSFVNTNNVQIYDRLIGFICIRANSTLSVSINDAVPFKIQRVGANEALFIGSLSAFKIELSNEEQSEVSATVHYSSYV